MVLLICWAAPARADIGVLRPLGEQTRNSDPGGFATLPDGLVLFSADDGTHGRELWRTDGTAAGTQEFMTLPETVVGESVAFEAFGDEVVFDVAAVTGFRFMATDGTAAGTRPLDVIPDVEARAPEHWHVAGGSLYFGYDDDLADGRDAGRDDPHRRRARHPPPVQRS